MNTQQQTEVVVIGGTPGGVAAAIAAARRGRRVVLVEAHAHFGGMSASGLGKSDVEKRRLIGGLFREFTQRVRRRYDESFGPDSENAHLCQSGYYYEPSVAEQVFLEMLQEHQGLTLLAEHRLVSAQCTGGAVVEATIASLRTGETTRLRGQVFIDATYEGDLLAAAGAQYRLGRESRDEFDEPHAGVVYFDYRRRRLLSGSTGEGDDRLPAYTYRLCLTTNAENAHRMTAAPPNYDRRVYLGYLDDLAAGRLAGPKTFKPGRGYEPAHFNTMVRALSVTPLPNGKTDVNINPRPLGFPFPEENAAYVEGDESQRRRTCDRIRELTLGLLWFLQTDAAIPTEHRNLANRYHLPGDEFADNAHFPFQLYVREGRRLAGEFTLTEHDVTRQPDAGFNHQREAGAAHPDTVAIGEFPIDSFPCRKRQPGDRIVLEGYLGMLDHITRPYEIPYRIMIPRTVDGLIVPVAASTSHVAFSSIRMEPTWMALGQAAGVAAHLAIRDRVPPRKAPIAELQRQLTADGQILEHQPLPTNAN
ncbi:MAG: FAD-dependent oxidoreductase [Pirellulaceae bacterium]